MLNEQKRKLLADDLKSLRATAKITYQGRYAAVPPPAAEVGVQASASDVAASAAALLDNKPVNEAPAARAASLEAFDAVAKPASGVDASTVNKGLGLK